MNDGPERLPAQPHPLVSVVVTGYRRPELLERTISSLLSTTRYTPRELILCDDGSPPPMLARMQALPFDVVLSAPKNEGLGRNTNKGIRAARGEFILQLQDDWLCVGPDDFIESALALMAERPDIGLVRFRSTPREGEGWERYVMSNGKVARVYHGNFFERNAFYAYTDNPHLKRASFHQRLGFYSEGVAMTRTELDFCSRVDAQDELRVAFPEGYECFRHIGAEASFNPSNRRARLKARLEAIWLTRWLLRVCIFIKNRRRR